MHFKTFKNEQQTSTEEVIIKKAKYVLYSSVHMIVTDKIQTLNKHIASVVISFEYCLVLHLRHSA